MTFLQPVLLWGLILSVIPFLLHRWAKQRLPVVELSTFRFLLADDWRQRRYWPHASWLLVVRTFVVLLLVVLFAQPRWSAWSDWFTVAESQDRLIVVDLSASMSSQSADESPIEQVRTVLPALLDRFKPADNVTLLGLGATPDPNPILADLAADSPRWQTVGPTLQAMPCTHQVAPLFHKVFPDELLRRPRMVYWLTDLQASAWVSGSFASEPFVWPQPGDRLQLIRLGAAKPAPNVRISLTGDTTRWLVGVPGRFQVQLHNYADEIVERTVTIQVGEEILASWPVKLTSGSNNPITIPWTPTHAGIVTVTSQITPADALLWDDTYQLTISIAPPPRIQFLNGSPGVDPIDDELLFVRAALATLGQGNPTTSNLPQAPRWTFEEMWPPMVTAPDETDTAAANDQEAELADLPLPEDSPPIRDATVSLLDWTPTRVGQADLIILADWLPQSKLLRQTLKEFVHQGGGLWILPGQKLTSKQLQHFLNPKTETEGTIVPIQVLAQPLSEKVVGNEIHASELLQSLQFIEHPIFENIQRDRLSLGLQFSTAPFFKYILPRHQPANSAQSLAVFADQSSAWLEVPFGAGKVFLSAFGWQRNASNLPLRPEFVPLLSALLQETLPPLPAQLPKSAVPGEPMRCFLPISWQNPQYRWLSADSRTPAPTAFSAKSSGAALPLFDVDSFYPMVRHETGWIAEFNAPPALGSFRLECRGDRLQTRLPTMPSIQPDAPTVPLYVSESCQTGFAVNLAATESDLRPATVSELSQWLGTKSWNLLDATQLSQPLAAQLRQQVDPDRWLLLGLLLLVLLEMLTCQTKANPAKQK